MRIGMAAAIMAAGLVVSGCGSPPATTAPTTTGPSVDRLAAASTSAPIWGRITDPSGARFAFPVGTKPALSTSAGAITRTYIANAGGGTVASIVIVPTPVKLNAKNFVIQYPLKLRSQGNSNVHGSAITPLTLLGFQGFQSELRYDSPPGPSHTYAKVAAIQFAKYFVVISALAMDGSHLTPSEIAQARAISARLLAGFTA